jgi:UDP-sugar transporter A1/2/3
MDAYKEKNNNRMSGRYASMLTLRNSILLGVCLQNAGYTLIRKYSTITENVSSKEILLMAEIIKVSFAAWYTVTDKEPSDAQGQGVDKLVWLIKNSGKMLVLAVIYGTMNILSFVALQYIGAGEFTICAQLKILTTAGFSVLILRTSMSWTRWRALVLLVLGCTLVASPTFAGDKAGKSKEVMLSVFGYAAVLTEVALSGFASIYFEKVVKSTTEVVTIWERNVQLGFYSIVMYSCIIAYEWMDPAIKRAPWSNWSILTVMVAAFGAAGGLLVAATLKYADSIMKTLAAAGAIVLSTVLGHVFLNGPLDVIVCIGGLCTIIAIANYTLDNTPPTSTIISSKPPDGDSTSSGGNGAGKATSNA